MISTCRFYPQTSKQILNAIELHLIFKAVFISSLMLASPMIFVNIVINGIMGIVSRAVPQMNVISVSFAINIGLGLLVFVVGSDEFFQTCFKIYTEKLGNWFQLMM